MSRRSVLVAAFCVVIYTSITVRCELPETLGLYVVYANSCRYDSSEGALSIENVVNSHGIKQFFSDSKLEIIEIFDSKCNSSLTIQAVIKHLTNPNAKPFHAIIGGGCSTSTNILVDVAQVQNVPLISYTPSYTRPFVDNYYQIYPSGESMVQSLVTVVNYYGWTQVAIITEMEDQFLEIERLVTSELKSKNLTVSVIQIWSHQYTKLSFGDTSTRIFILNTFENTARKVLCTAYSEDIYYPGYGWLLYGWYNPNWLLRVDDINCTQDELARSVNHAIVLQQHQTVKTNESYISQFANDAVRALALALNETQNMIDNMADVEGCDGPINNNTQCLLNYNLLRSMFNGSSGYVSFNEDGSRNVKNVLLFQYRTNLSMPIFGIVDISASNITYIDGESNETVWPVGVPPDGSPIMANSTYSLILVVIMYIWGSAGILYTFVCLIFNIVFRNRKIVRLTSPNLNYFIICGALLLFAAPYVVLIQSSDSHVLLFSCISNIWQISLGTTLIFAPVLAKMLRIHRIFQNPRASKKVLTDWHLFLIVVILVSVNVCILLLGTAIPFTRPVISFSLDREFPSQENEMGIQVDYYGVNCYTIGSLIWVIVVEIYIVVLQAIAIVLAIKTRHVKVEAVNDSKEVVAVVYIVTACSIASIVIPFVLQNYSNISEGLYLTAVLVGTSSAVILMFVPKMWSLYKDPDGENVFEQQSMRSGSVLQSHLHRQDSERIETLQREVGTLKERLNSMRLTSVREFPEISDDFDEKPNSNGLKYRDRLPSDVFSSPTTPDDNNAYTIAKTIDV